MTFEQFRPLDGKGTPRLIVRVDSPRHFAWRLSGEHGWWKASSRMGAVLMASDVLGKPAAELRWRRTVPRLPGRDGEGTR